MKQTLVLFTDNGARIYINPPNAAQLIEQGALLNPDLTALKRIPPHTWKRSGNKVGIDQSKLKQYYKDTNCEDCLKKLSFYERFKGWIKELV